MDKPSKTGNLHIQALLVSLAFAMTVNVLLKHKSSAFALTAELAKVISIHQDQSTIAIRNWAGQEKLIKVKPSAVDDLQLDAVYWVEHTTSFGRTPRLVSYQLVPYDE